MKPARVTFAIQNSKPADGDVAVYDPDVKMLVWRKSPDVYRHAGTASGLERWYCAGCANGLALTTGAPSVNILRAIPFVAPMRKSVLDRIAVNVTTLLSGNLRLGIYSNVVESNLYPGSLLAESTELSSLTTGVKAATISLALEAGKLYWMTHLGSAAATLRCLAVGGMSPLLGFTNALGTAVNVGVSVARTYGALPTTFPAGGANITAVPVPAIFVRFAS